MTIEFHDEGDKSRHGDFQQWRYSNPQGCVLSFSSSKKARLHGSLCGHMGNTEWTTASAGQSLTQARKVSSSSEEKLRAWAANEGVTISICKDCERSGFIAGPTFATNEAIRGHEFENTDLTRDQLIIDGAVPDISYRTEPPEETVHPRIVVKPHGPCVYMHSERNGDHRGFVTLDEFLDRLASGQCNLAVTAYRRTDRQTTISFNRADRVTLSERLERFFNHRRRVLSNLVDERGVGAKLDEPEFTSVTADGGSVPFDEGPIRALRDQIASEEACYAFDLLVGHAATLHGFACRAGSHGYIRDFRYIDKDFGEWLFAFTANARHLLFYIRLPGVRRLQAKRKLLDGVGLTITDTADGQWKLRLENAQHAASLIGLLFGNPEGVIRSTPDDAGEWMTMILEGYSSRARQACMDFLAESIRFASARASDRWSLSVSQRCLRLNVGWTNVIIVDRSAVSLLVDQDPELGAGRMTDHEYVRAGRSRLLEFGVAESDDRVLQRARDRHQAAILLAAKYPMPPHLLSAHSEPAVEYCWRYLDSTEPVPRPSAHGSQSERLAVHSNRDDGVLEDEAQRRIADRTDIGPREKERLIKARVGQGIFRRNVKFVECSCRVTGVRDLRHLRASHVKPWRLASDEEKLDGCNGLLLAPHIDHLFDRGFISFTDDGSLLVSRNLDRTVLEFWHLPLPVNVGEFRPEQRKYLHFHRSEIFEKAAGIGPIESDPSELEGADAK